MDAIWWYIGAGATIGGVQLVLGIGIGLWIRRGTQRLEGSDDREIERAREFARELQSLTSDVTKDVDRHQTQIHAINSQLGEAKEAAGDSLTELVVGVVGKLMRANQDLQSQLSSAETELQRQTAEIETHLSKAMTDELTGLPNRRAFDDNLRTQLTNWRRHRVPFTLMLLDIDHFKQVNDTHGHVASDCVLRSFAEATKNALRKPDFVARFGGEEFAVILPYTSLDDSVIAAQKTLAAIESAVTRHEGTELRITTSAGLATCLDGESPIDIVKRADQALYASKHAGRNCGHTHDGSTCQPISRITEPRPDGEPLMPIDGIAELSPEMKAICANLRDRAVEVANQGVETP